MITGRRLQLEVIPEASDLGGISFHPVEPDLTLICVDRFTSPYEIAAGPEVLRPGERFTLSRFRSLRQIRTAPRNLGADPDDQLVIGLARGSASEAREAWRDGKVDWETRRNFYAWLTRPVRSWMEENSLPSTVPVIDDPSLVETERFHAAADRILRGLVAEKSILLTGDSGVGKTACMSLLARMAEEMRLPGILQGIAFFELGVELFQEGAEAEKAKIRRTHIDQANAVFRIDEASRLTSRGYSSSAAIDNLLLFCERARVILASDQSHLLTRSREALARRLVQVPLAPADRGEALEIARSFSAQMQDRDRIRCESGVVERAASQSLKSRFANPHAVREIMSATRSRAIVDGRGEVTVADVDAQAAESLAGVFAVQPKSASALAAAIHQAGYVGRVSFIEEMAEQLMLALESRLRRDEPERRPVFSALVSAGPGSGVGFLFRCLARALSGSERVLVEIDGADYREPHETARLIGAPPAYVGYEDGSLIEGRLLADKSFIFAVSNLELGHPSLASFVQGLLQGHLVTGRGNNLPLSHTLVLVGTHVGATGAGRVIGFGDPAPRDRSNELRAELARALRLEPDHFDLVAGLDPFASASVREILAGRLAAVGRLIGRTVSFSPESADRLLAIYRPEDGLGPVLAACSGRVEKPLLKAEASGRLGGAGRPVRVGIVGEDFAFLGEPEGDEA